MKQMAYCVRTIAGEAIKARGKATEARAKQRKECMKPLRLSNSDVDQLWRKQIVCGKMLTASRQRRHPERTARPRSTRHCVTGWKECNKLAEVHTPTTTLLSRAGGRPGRSTNLPLLAVSSSQDLLSPRKTQILLRSIIKKADWRTWSRKYLGTNKRNSKELSRISKICGSSIDYPNFPQIHII